MPLPQCQYECKMPATYDFVTAEELWAYGCTLHWMKHRRTKQLGPGHGQHLTDGRALPERDPNARIFATPDGPLPDPTRRHRASPQPRSAPRPRSLKEFHDMEPSPDGQKQPKAGVQLVALELGRGEGFTMAELQAKLDETTRPGAHDALKLMTFMHTDRGWGWKQGEDGRIRVQP